MVAAMNDPARDILDIAYVDPARAIELARSALSEGDVDESAVLYRAIGVAQMLLGDYEMALDSLEGARQAAVLAGDDHEHLLAVLSMAGPTTVVGTMTEAAHLVESSAHLAKTPYLGARLAYQRGVLSMRAGDRVRALSQFEASLPGLREAGDEVTLRAALQNLGLLYMQAGDLTEAEDHLEEALAIASRRGEEPAVSGIEHNLGLLASYRGDITGALGLLLDSDQIFMRLTGSPAPQHVARAEVLLSAGLFGEAGALAREIAAANRSKGDTEHLADALIVAAKAALLGGLPDQAQTLADEAVDVYRSNRRSGAALEAEMLSIDARVQAGGPTPALLRRASRILEMLERERQLLPTAEARLLVAKLAMGLGDEATAVTALEPVARSDTGPVEARIRARVARAQLRLLADDRRGADAAARSGLRLIDHYQSVVGATDIRMGLEQHGAELGAIGVDLALGAGGSRRLLQWMERTRARALRHRPVSPAGGGEALDEVLARLRKVEADLRDEANRGDPRLERERRRLQSEVQTADRLKPAGSGRAEVFDIPGLIDTLGDRELLEIGVHRDRLLGVVVSGGRVRRVDLAPFPSLVAELGHLRFALRRAARLGRSLPTAELERLSGALVAPAGLGDGEMVLVPPPSLMALPWSALPGLTGRSLTVVPSAEMWWRATRARRPSGRVAVVGGPDLGTASDEVEAIGDLHAGALVLPPGTSVGTALAALEGASVAHIACHARFEAQNPMFSALRLGDGDLSVYDLERLERAPGAVVLSACDSGYTEAKEGVELAGLTSALLSMGTRSVVASVGLVPDAPATSQLMVRFHRALLEGRAGPEALAWAQAGAGDDPLGVVAAASFLYVGA
jgi:tetratricopeptide (TPR) repeat protein